jgi:hypothetical protein
MHLDPSGREVRVTLESLHVTAARRGTMGWRLKSSRHRGIRFTPLR